MNQQTTDNKEQIGIVSTDHTSVGARQSKGGGQRPGPERSPLPRIRICRQKWPATVRDFALKSLPCPGACARNWTQSGRGWGALRLLKGFQAAECVA